MLFLPRDARSASAVLLSQRPVSTTAALRCALRAIVSEPICSDMLRFIALRYYRSDIETHISSLFNGNHFHYSCAALRCALRVIVNNSQ